MAVVNGTHANDAMLELDALIVGAGFGGVYQLKKLRDHGWNVKLVESGSDFGTGTAIPGLELVCGRNEKITAPAIVHISSLIPPG